MFGNDIFTRVKRSENKKMAEIAQFLHENDLSVDTTVEVFITVTRDEKLIACGGIAGNIIKCVAISESVRGEGLALTLATELINLAYERHSTHLFIYTKTEYEALFRQCGFSTLTSVPGVMVLMENSATRLKRYAESLKKFCHPGNKIGCIVMNANPFTNGHRYLIQQAAAQCDWLHLFLVKEDSSRFPYEDRLDLVLKGTADIPRLTVHRGSEYIISRATFPCYFIKEQSVINHCYTEIDLKIFRQYLAPALGVTHRFVGTEPFCRVTAQYNRICATGWKRRLSPHRPSNWLKLSGCVTRRCRYPLPGYVNCWRKTISRLSRRWSLQSRCIICRTCLSTPARTRQLVKRPPHEKQVKNENKPARRCRHP